MKNRLLIPAAVIFCGVIFSIIALIMIRSSQIRDNYGTYSPTGSLLSQGAGGTRIAERPLSSADLIEIRDEDLIRCCSFTGQEGDEESCYAIRGHGCAYCSDYCS